MIKLPSGVLAPAGAVIDPGHPLASVLQHVWTGAAPDNGRDHMRGAIAGVHANATRHGTPLGLALRGDGTVTTGLSSNVSVINRYPFTMLGFGMFASAGGAWQLGFFQSSGGGTTARIAIAGSTSVSLDLRYNFGTNRQITVTLPTAIGVPICMIAHMTSATDYWLVANGQVATGSLSPGTLNNLDRYYNLADTFNGWMWMQGVGQGVPLEIDYARRVTVEPRRELSKLFRRRIWVPVTAATGTTGISATTNADDTSTASGTTTVTGTLSRTNANDTSSASGTTTILGTSATTNADDTSAASGSVGGAATGTSATTNANDASSAAGTTTIVGTSAATNANDTGAAAGTTTVKGTSGSTNADDSVTAAGWAGSVSGTSTTTNADDTSQASGTVGDVIEAAPLRGAGRSKRTRQRKDERYVLAIDDKDVIVSSLEEAEALLDGVKAEAEAKAEQALKLANGRQRAKLGTVMRDARRAMDVPQIQAPPELADYARQVLQDIRSRYEEQLQTIEITALLRKREQQQEEDDEDVLMLIA